MAVTYTTHIDVSSLLQCGQFSASTSPSQTEVESIINRKEARIDQVTGHAWRTASVSVYEYHDIRANYILGLGSRVKLAHRTITTLASGTDALEVWDGSSWVNYLTTKTEGRASDYWVDYTNGVIYLKTVNVGTWFPRDRGMRIKYRYGESTVPEDIEDACTKMAAIDVLMLNDKTVLMPEGGAGVPFATKIDIWREQVKEILYSRKEFQPFTQ